MMALPSGYVREIKSIDETLKRYNKIISDLRKKRNIAKDRLVKWMQNHHMDEYEGFKLNKLSKQRVPTKPKKEKKEDALKLFNEVGINDPEEFWKMFQATQKKNNEKKDNDDIYKII